MVKKSTKTKRNDKQKPRLSVTLPLVYYSQLQSLSEKKRVSIAWIVRDAVEQYITDGQNSKNQER